MKKNQLIFCFIVLISICLFCAQVCAQPILTEKEQEMLNAIEKLDTSIVKYFPRWKVCEPSIQIHIFESFRQAGYNADLLNKSNIEVLAAPGDFDPEYGNYQILLVSCGDVAMSPYQINTYFTANLRKVLSGEISHSPTGIGRTYCYKDIPPEVPVSAYQAEAIINYYQPTDVTHAISLSLFEQDLKIGESGFWLRSVFGNDDAGYQFWSSGQASIQLQRPLYVNRDSRTSRAIPYLLDIQLGGGYRIETGINPEGTIFSWLPQRHLNASQSGDFVAGLNFHMPFAPQFGVSFYARIPFENPKTQDIERRKWGVTDVRSLINDGERDEIIDGLGNSIDEVVPIMQSSGKFSVFYNWWMDKKKPENFLRIDLGVSYVETRELALLSHPTDVWLNTMSNDNITGLKTYKPSEAMDWLFLKLEYRNQDIWPFGVSVQIANQTMLGKAWIPLLGNWFLLEMKYSHILRDARPYELQNFFMLSPVIRITI